MSQPECRLCEEATKAVGEYRPMSRRWITYMLSSFVVSVAIFLTGIVIHHLVIGKIFFALSIVFSPILMTFFIVALIYYFPENAISFNRFWYLDGEHRAHIHLRKPEYVKGRGRIDHRDCTIPGWILQIPYAGWIRRSRILARPNKFFRVVWGRKDRVRVEDQHGNQIMLYPATLIRLMKRYHYVDDMLLDDQLDLQSMHAEAMKKLTSLGEAIVDELLFIDTMPGTMGRSRHAQKIRDDLRGILAKHFSEAEYEQLCTVVIEERNPVEPVTEPPSSAAGTETESPAPALVIGPSQI